MKQSRRGMMESGEAAELATGRHAREARLACKLTREGGSPGREEDLHEGAWAERGGGRVKGLCRSLTRARSTRETGVKEPLVREPGA